VVKEMNHMKMEKGGKMKRIFAFLLAAMFALVPQAYAQEEVTVVGGEPETRLTVEVPEEVLANENFNVEVTVCLDNEEEEPYKAEVKTCIAAVQKYNRTYSRLEEEDIEDLLSELEPEEIEEACKSGEPIELDETHYVSFKSYDTENFLVTNLEKTTELSLQAPPIRVPLMSVKCDGVITTVKDLETEVTFITVIIPIRVKG